MRLKDDAERVKNIVISSDMIVFVTPLYYYGMTAQLKTLIDRFCSFNGSISRKGLKCGLIAVERTATIGRLTRSNPAATRLLSI